MDWQECLQISMTFEQAYSLDPPQREIVYKYASKVPKDGVMVELGVANGPTAAVFCYCAKHMGSVYYGVDNFSLTHSEQAVREKMAFHELPCNLLVGNTREVPWDEHRQIDLILIDADHSAPVQYDCERWIPWVKSGGIVMFHDFDNTRTYGHAHEAIWRFGDANTPEWPELDFWNGLMVKQKP